MIEDQKLLDHFKYHHKLMEVQEIHYLITLIIISLALTAPLIKVLCNLITSIINFRLITHVLQ